MTTQLNQEKLKSNTLNSQLDQAKNNNQQFINQINIYLHHMNYHHEFHPYLFEVKLYNQLVPILKKFIVIGYIFQKSL